MKHILTILLAAALLIACDDAVTDYNYKNESYGEKSLCLFTWHGTAKPATFVTDNGEEYRVKTLGNYGVNIKPDTAYRATVYFSDADNSHNVVLYQLAFVPVLGDSTHIKTKTDTLSMIGSLWYGGGFINATLHFKHSGEQFMRQTIAYRVDKVEATETGRNVHLSLLYLQNNVEKRYDESICVSIDPKRIGVKSGDKITMHTVTKDFGEDQKTFEF